MKNKKTNKDAQQLTISGSLATDCSVTPSQSVNSKTKKDLIQSRIWSCVIEACDEQGFFDFTGTRIKNDCSKLSLMFSASFWFILHDKDFNDKGELERRHYHLVLEFPTRHTKEAVIKLLTDYFALKPNRISADKATSLESVIRYLIHEDELSDYKAHYSPSDIFTNDPSTCALALASSLEHLTADYLLDVVDKSHSSVSAIVRTIGADNYVKYRWLIFDLINGLERVSK
jgi:hypothetical protein